MTNKHATGDAKLRAKLMPTYRKAHEQCWNEATLRWRPPLSKKQLVEAGFDAGVAFMAHRRDGPDMRAYLRRWWRLRAAKVAKQREREALDTPGGSG